MAERRFVPKNKARIYSGGGVCYGCHYEAPNYIGEGYDSAFAIDVDSSGDAFFRGSDGATEGSVISMHSSFRVDENGYYRPNRGQITTIVPVTASLALSNLYAQSTFVGQGASARLTIPDTTSIPIGFFCYLTADSGSTFALLPVGAVEIKATTSATGLNFVNFYQAKAQKPIILDNCTVEIFKLTATIWVVRPWNVRQAVV